MKKTILFLKLVCLSLSLTACKAEDPESVFEVTEAQIQDTTAAATEPSPPATSWPTAMRSCF